MMDPRANGGGGVASNRQQHDAKTAAAPSAAVLPALLFDHNTSNRHRHHQQQNTSSNSYNTTNTSSASLPLVESPEALQEVFGTYAATLLSSTNRNISSSPTNRNNSGSGGGGGGGGSQQQQQQQHQQAKRATAPPPLQQQQQPFRGNSGGISNSSSSGGAAGMTGVMTALHGSVSVPASPVGFGSGSGSGSGLMLLTSSGSAQQTAPAPLVPSAAEAERAVAMLRASYTRMHPDVVACAAHHHHGGGGDDASTMDPTQEEGDHSHQHHHQHQRLRCRDAHKHLSPARYGTASERVVYYALHGSGGPDGRWGAQLEQHAHRLRDFQQTLRLYNQEMAAGAAARREGQAMVLQARAAESCLRLGIPVLTDPAYLEQQQHARQQQHHHQHSVLLRQQRQQQQLGASSGVAVEGTTATTGCGDPTCACTSPYAPAPLAAALERHRMRISTADDHQPLPQTPINGSERADRHANVVPLYAQHNRRLSSPRPGSGGGGGTGGGRAASRPQSSASRGSGQGHGTPRSASRGTPTAGNFREQQDPEIEAISAGHPPSHDEHGNGHPYLYDYAVLPDHWRLPVARPVTLSKEVQDRLITGPLARQREEKEQQQEKGGGSKKKKMQAHPSEARHTLHHPAASAEATTRGVRTVAPHPPRLSSPGHGGGGTPAAAAAAAAAAMSDKAHVIRRLSDYRNLPHSVKPSSPRALRAMHRIGLDRSHNGSPPRPPSSGSGRASKVGSGGPWPLSPTPPGTAPTRANPLEEYPRPPHHPHAPSQQHTGTHGNIPESTADGTLQQLSGTARRQCEVRQRLAAIAERSEARRAAIAAKGAAEDARVAELRAWQKDPLRMAAIARIADEERLRDEREAAQVRSECDRIIQQQAQQSGSQSPTTLSPPRSPHRHQPSKPPLQTPPTAANGGGGGGVSPPRAATDPEGGRALFKDLMRSATTAANTVPPHEEKGAELSSVQAGYPPRAGHHGHNPDVTSSAAASAACPPADPSVTALSGFLLRQRLRQMDNANVIDKYKRKYNVYKKQQQHQQEELPPAGAASSSRGGGPRRRSSHSAAKGPTRPPPHVEDRRLDAALDASEDDEV